jgi:hypothetical protein
MLYLKALPRYLSGETEESHETIRIPVSVSGSGNGLTTTIGPQHLVSHHLHEITANMNQN